MTLSILLWGIPQAMRMAARMYPEFAERLKEKDVVAQIRLRDKPEGRWIELKNGEITTGSGLHDKPDITLAFKNAETAKRFLSRPWNLLERIDAAKNFKILLEGPDELATWFLGTLGAMEPASWKYGTDMGGGVTRYTNGTNGGPLFVYVKDGKILRITPIDFSDEDPEGWTITARGKTFSPERRMTLAPHGACQKSMVYAKNRLLYPMKRVDFDPNGERNPQNRGKSEFERISWEEAIDIVVSEIRRAKATGPGAICVDHGSHHQWGNLGHYLSAFNRFWNLLGVTKLMHSPDSWEGWFWGAMHHWGNSARLGCPEMYGTVEDCLKNCEMIVFWSSDPDTTYAFEGVQRREWARELGIKMVHIDPYLNHTAAHLGGKWIAPRPSTDAALAQAICHVWITEGLYDKEFVAHRTTGFDEWKDYILGETDGQPKTPEWQEPETGVPARDVRALAREWGSKKTYLGAGSWGVGVGGANRGPTGMQWARMMTILGAMQGWGRPGVNFGNLQFGAPLDYNFYFPGYAEGCISGDLAFSANSANNYQRMPHIVTMATTRQAIPRMWFPEAITQGKSMGYITDVASTTGQFFPFFYPSPGHVPVKMLYKYGSQLFGTMVGGNRWARAYQHPSLEFIVNQSIWKEGETPFCDVILPACTVFERWDIGETYGIGPGYALHMNSMNNYRIISMQHKAIEPLGESMSDYNIFLSIAEKLGLGSLYSEGGTSELEWCRRIFESSDAARHISWRKFLKKGYFVIPPDPEPARTQVANRWFYEGRKKDTPDPYPLPSDYVSSYLEGLQTPSGKFEFIATNLKRIDDPDRPPLNKYMPTYEAPERNPEVADFPFQFQTAHSRYTYHVMGDVDDGPVGDIREHRVFHDGRYYFVARMNRQDAEALGISDGDLVRIWNRRGSVVFAAQLTERILPGIIHTYSGSAKYDPVGEPGRSTDLGGCANMLCPKEPITSKGHGMKPNAVRVAAEKWTGVDTWQPVEAE